MRVDETQLRTVRNRVRVEDVLPPKAAVAALFAVASVNPANAIASASWADGPGQGAVSWHLLAHTPNGVVVVKASADGPWQWRHGPDSAPVAAQVVARLFPLSRIVSIGVTDVRVWDDQYISIPELTALHSWVLTVDGEVPIVVQPDGGEATRERHREFFETLATAL